MNQEQAIALLKESAPIFDMAQKYGAFDFEKNLQFGQYSLIDNIKQVWFADWTGPEIEEICRKAGYNPSQVKQVSRYLWHEMLTERRDKIEGTDYKIYLIFLILTFIGILIIGFMILPYINDIPGSGVRDSTVEITLAISLIICAPIFGLGLIIRWLVKKYLGKRIDGRNVQVWPKGLFPDNEEGQAYFEM